MDRLLRMLGLLSVRLFYRTIAIEHPDRVPASGPVIVVANHPNGLLDPVVTQLALHKPMAFLAKSTLFGNPFGRWLMRAFNAIPIYRPRDGADTNQNERTFDLCRAHLGRGGWLMLFPEGTSHSDPSMRPLKTGAARIALSAEAASSFALGLRILPVGLIYEDKEIFRTSVAASVGLPLTLKDYASQYASDERATVAALTEAIDRALGSVVLEADSDELWRGFLAVAAWTHPEAQRDVAIREARARELAQAYRRLSADDPDAAAAVVGSARRFAQILRSIGVANPFAIDPAHPPTATTIAGSLLPLLFLAPMALVGIVLGFLPYRAIALLLAVLQRRSLDTDLTSTMKALFGLVFFLITYLAEATAAGVLFGPLAGLAMLILAPASGFAAIRWLERLALRREALRGWWLRANRTGLAEIVTRRQRELCDLVESALDRQ